jgi:hypothetical protein
MSIVAAAISLRKCKIGEISPFFMKSGKAQILSASAKTNGIGLNYPEHLDPVFAQQKIARRKKRGLSCGGRELSKITILLT